MFYKNLIPSKTVIVGCTHFGHENIVRFEKRFDSIYEHDIHILKKIQTKLDENSGVLIHLGDVGNVEMIGRLKCAKKILVMGNHDKGDYREYKRYFDTIIEFPTYIHENILLSHYPQIKSKSVLNVHAHLHNSWMKEQFEDGSYYNAGIHMMNYEPVTLKEIIDIANKLEKRSNDFLYEEFAESYKFSNPRDNIVVDKDGLILLEESRIKHKNFKDAYVKQKTKRNKK